MTKRRVTKLLAVVAMTTGTVGAAMADPARTLAGCPVTAAVVVAPTPDPTMPRGLSPVLSPVVAAAESALVAVGLLRTVAIELAQPRTMPSGAPACGNVASRAPRPRCATRETP